MSSSSENESLYRAEYDSISQSLGRIESKINDFYSLLTRIDTYAVEIPASLARIRSQGYIYFGNLEDEANTLIDSWLKIRHSYLHIIERLKTYSPQIESLRKRLSSLSSAKGTSSDFLRLRNVRAEVNALDATVDSLISDVKSSTQNINSRFNRIKGRLHLIESTLNRLSTASFKLMDGENIVSSFEVKLLGDKNKEKGILFITDRRLIFEAIREIPLKKILFITTKKEIVKNVEIDVPIGYVSQVNKGRVGFFARGGIFIEFRQGAPFEELVFDLKDYLIPYVINDINYVLSGRADKERLIGPKEIIEKRIPQVIKCPVCGAPVKKEIVRGMASITCEYCGAVIQIT